MPRWSTLWEPSAERTSIPAGSLRYCKLVGQILGRDIDMSRAVRTGQHEVSNAEALHLRDGHRGAGGVLHRPSIRSLGGR